jgi:hypothetical protein
MTRKRVQGRREVRAPHTDDLDDEIEVPSFVSIRSSRRSDSSRPDRPLRRKDAQFSKQVLLAVQVAAREWRADPVLDELEWERAVPWPRLSRMRLTVIAPPGREAEATAALERASSFLRAAVAESTSRKRTPSLVFLVLSKKGGVHEA